MSDVEADAPPPAQEEESAAAAAAGTETAASEATAGGEDASAAAAVAAKAEASSDEEDEGDEEDDEDEDDDSEAEALAAAEAVAAAEAKAKAAADAAAAAKKQTEEAAAAAATASGADSAAAAKAAAAAAAKAGGPLASDEDELMRLSTELEAALARVAVLEEQNADLQSKYRKYKDLAKRLHRQRSASVVEAPRRAGRSLSHSDEPGGDKKTPSRSSSKDGPPGAAAALATKEGRSDSITSHDSAASGGSGGKRSGGGGGGGGASASGTGDISDDEEDSASAASGTDSAASGSGSGSGSGKASSSAGGGGGGGGAGGGGAGDEDEAEELTPDGDHDQVLSEELLTDEGELRNATPSQLVRRLAGVKPIDGNYARDFVVTYSHFSTAAGLLELLERRFEFVAPDGADPKLVKYYDTWRGPVQMRVINILRKLVETNPTEFAGVLDDDDDDDDAGGAAAAAGASGASEDMAQVRVMWKRLLAAMGEAGKPDWATRLEETLDHRRRTGLVVAAAEVPLSEMEATALLKKRRESSPVNSFDDLDPLELSRQLTLFEWTLFSKVSPNELRSGNWEKEKTKHLCPGVLGVTNWFNLFSNWIVTDIVGRPDLKPRCKALQRWICVGAHCLSMGNYQAVCEVVAALNRAPVSRLASTWAIVNKALRKSFDHMTELMGGSRNYADYRARMEAAQPPLVPYLGVFTKDLLAIESGNPDFVNEEGEEIPADGDGDDAHQDGDAEAAAAAADDRPQRRVNWTKMRMIAANVHQIQACQGKRFPFKPLDTAQAYLSAHFDGTAGDKGSTIITDDATLHQLSKQCEDGKNSQAHASSSSGDKGTARLFRRTKSTRGTNSGADED